MNRNDNIRQILAGRSLPPKEIDESLAKNNKLKFDNHADPAEDKELFREDTLDAIYELLR